MGAYGVPVGGENNKGTGTKIFIANR